MQRPNLAAESQLIDDGTGDLTIYRVNSNGDIAEIPKRKNVALFSADCYLIHYIVTVRKFLQTIAFYSFISLAHCNIVHNLPKSLHRIINACKLT